MNSPAAYEKGTPFDVQASPEYERIYALPKRDWVVDIEKNDLHKRMSNAFKLPGGKYDLHLEQAAALADAHDLRGLFAPLPAGAGKTILSFLLPVVIPGVQRPMLMLRAGLIEKTWREFQVLQRNFVCHPELLTRKRFDDSVISYESLGRDSGFEALNNRKPDILICDEADLLSNWWAARTKKVARYMVAFPDTIFCGMTGTPTKRSVMDYWHLLYWALRHKMPLPRIREEAEKWAEVLDERKTEAISRRGPGVLLNFCSDKERLEAEPYRSAPLGRTQQMPVFGYNLKLAAARKGFQRRLRETPGVVLTSDARPNVLGTKTPVQLQVRRINIEPSDTIKEHLRILREKPWTTPNGDILTQPMQVWQYARELSTGFFYRWRDPAPPEWLHARRHWNWLVREILQPDGSLHQQYKHLDLDSPMQVALAVTGRSPKINKDALEDAAEAAGYNLDDLPGGVELEDLRDPKSGVFLIDTLQVVGANNKPRIDSVDIVDAYKRWVEVRGTYKIVTVAEWLDNTVIDYCKAWLRDNGSGIVWTEHRAFGERLARECGTGFCSKGGEDANGRPIEDYDGAPVVASVAANHQGRNLQPWFKSLVVTAPPVGKLWEQLLARSHRQGQKQARVYYDWIAACSEQDAGFDQMMADARYIQGTMTEQRLLYAEHV